MASCLVTAASAETFPNTRLRRSLGRRLVSCPNDSSPARRPGIAA